MFKIIVLATLLSVISAAPQYIGQSVPLFLSTPTGWIEDFPTLAALVRENARPNVRVVPQPFISAHGPSAAPQYITESVPLSLSTHTGWSKDFPIIASLIEEHAPSNATVLPQPFISAHGPLAVERAWEAVRATGSQDLNGYTFPLRYLTKATNL